MLRMFDWLVTVFIVVICFKHHLSPPSTWYLRAVAELYSATWMFELWFRFENFTHSRHHHESALGSNNLFNSTHSMREQWAFFEVAESTVACRAILMKKMKTPLDESSENWISALRTKHSTRAFTLGETFPSPQSYEMLFWYIFSLTV